MVFKSLVRGALTVGGYMNPLNYGIQGRIIHNYANKKAGIIGRAARKIGYRYMSENTRNKFADVADTAIDFMPTGRVKNTLKRINDYAQGRLGKPIKGAFSSGKAKQLG